MVGGCWLTDASAEFIYIEGWKVAAQTTVNRVIYAVGFILLPSQQYYLFI